MVKRPLSNLEYLRKQIYRATQARACKKSFIHSFLHICCVENVEEIVEEGRLHNALLWFYNKATKHNLHVPLFHLGDLPMALQTYSRLKAPTYIKPEENPMNEKKYYAGLILRENFENVFDEFISVFQLPLI